MSTRIPMLSLFALMLAATTRAATIVVHPGGDGDYTEIQTAIDAADDGDEILVRPGEYVIRESIDFNRLHDPRDATSPPVKNVVLRSEAGPEETVIRLAKDPADLATTRVLTFESGETDASVLEGFTLTGSPGTSGVPSSQASGGVLCRARSSPTISNCTISGNQARRGSAIMCSFPSMLVNSVVWGNTPETIACENRSHCLTDADPLFVDGGVFDFERYVIVTIAGEELRLPDFIVEAPDFHLRAESPAIDAGSSRGAPTFDIEGTLRPCGGTVDIGAYESGGCGDAFPFKRGDADADGAVDVIDVVSILRYLFNGGDEPLCLKAADADDDDGLSATDTVFLLDFLFLRGKAVPSPFPGCGWDGTVDDLTCDSYPPCE